MSDYNIEEYYDEDSSGEDTSQQVPQESRSRVTLLSLYHLEEHVFLHILSFLDFSDLRVSVSLVNRQWSALAFNISLWSDVSFSVRAEDTPKRYLRFLSALPEQCFSHISFRSQEHGGPIPLKLFRVFSTVAEGLQHLEIQVHGDMCANEYAKVQALRMLLQNADNLQTLTLAHDGLSQYSLVQVVQSASPSLASLRVEKQVSQELIDLIPTKFTELTSLNLRNVTSESGFEVPGSFINLSSKLTSLEIGYAPPAIMSLIGSMNNASTIKLTHVDDAELLLEALAVHGSSLQSLKLGATGISQYNIFELFPNLRELELLDYQANASWSLFDTISQMDETRIPALSTLIVHDVNDEHSIMKMLASLVSLTQFKLCYGWHNFRLLLTNDAISPYTDQQFVNWNMEQLHLDCWLDLDAAALLMTCFPKLSTIKLNLIIVNNTPIATIFSNHHSAIAKLTLGLDMKGNTHLTEMDAEYLKEQVKAAWCPPVDTLHVELTNFEKFDVYALQSLLCNGCMSSQIVLSDHKDEDNEEFNNNSSEAWNELIRLIGDHCNQSASLSFQFKTNHVYFTSWGDNLFNNPYLTKLELTGVFENMYESLIQVTKLVQLRHFHVEVYVDEEEDDRIECFSDTLLDTILSSCTEIESLELSGSFEENSQVASILASSQGVTKLKYLALKGLTVNCEQICGLMRSATQLRELVLTDKPADEEIMQILDCVVQIDYERADYPILKFLAEADESFVTLLSERYPDVTLYMGLLNHDNEH